MDTQPIRLALNGQPTTADCRADMTVLEWLRGPTGLRGTKEGCAEGDCGACSVLVRRHGSERHEPANACIMLMGQLDGAALVTVEGLAASGPDGHAVQIEMARNGASQCGFCTPGIVAALAGLLDRDAAPAEPAIHDALAGNLCRCTGYRPIVEAAQAAAKTCVGALPGAVTHGPSCESGTADSAFLAPRSLSELLAMRARHPDAILLAGGTDLALDVAQAKTRWSRAILTRHVEELRLLAERDGELFIGGAVTWEEMLAPLARHWPSFATLVRRFGSTQIRSMGTLGGNLGTASPIGDGAPALLALGASLDLTGPDGTRTLPLADYFTGYRKTVRAADEIISAIRIPLPQHGDMLRVHKVSKRYDQDISTVCGAFWIQVETDVIQDVRIAYGGMAATPMRCTAAEDALRGSTLEAGLHFAKAAVLDTFSPLSDMRGTADYRATVAANLLDRLALEAAGEPTEVMAL